MDLKKFRYYLSEKYKNRIELPKELLDFAEKSPTEEYYKHDVDNIPTHFKQDPKTGEKFYYSEHSKVFKNVDPNIDDPHSI